MVPESTKVPRCAVLIKCGLSGRPKCACNVHVRTPTNCFNGHFPGKLRVSVSQFWHRDTGERSFRNISSGIFSA